MIILHPKTNSIVGLKCGMLYPGKPLYFETLPLDQRTEALGLHTRGVLYFEEILPPAACDPALDLDKKETAPLAKRRPPLFLPFGKKA